MLPKTRTLNPRPFSQFLLRECYMNWQRLTTLITFSARKAFVIAFDQPKNGPITGKSIIITVIQRLKHEEQLDVDIGQSIHRRHTTNGWRQINGMQLDTQMNGMLAFRLKMDADYYIFRENYSISINRSRIQHEFDGWGFCLPIT